MTLSLVMKAFWSITFCYLLFGVACSVWSFCRVYLFCFPFFIIIMCEALSLCFSVFCFHAPLPWLGVVGTVPDRSNLTEKSTRNAFLERSN